MGAEQSTGDVTDGQTGHRLRPKERASVQDIVVVASGGQDSSFRNLGGDTELLKLQEIPRFSPLLRGVGGIEGPISGPQLERLDACRLMQLCLRYQHHLQQCAEAVSFDQNALAQRLHEVEGEVSALFGTLQERQRRFARYAEQVKKVAEISALLRRIRMGFDQTLPLMEKLNGLLPEAERLEPFTLQPENRASQVSAVID
uniref:BLOC-1-related complex subunit 5 n=1 Tax=Eptatretus burgeri TaxID=7764 RepID=A0A8C4PY05_EPTBU